MVLYGALDQCVFLLSGSEMDKHRVCPGSRPPKVKRLHRLGNYQTQSLSERAVVTMSLVRLALPPTKVIAHNSPQRVLGLSFFLGLLRRYFSIIRPYRFSVVALACF